MTYPRPVGMARSGMVHFGLIPFIAASVSGILFVLASLARGKSVELSEFLKAAICGAAISTSAGIAQRWAVSPNAEDTQFTLMVTIGLLATLWFSTKGLADAYRSGRRRRK